MKQKNSNGQITAVKVLAAAALLLAAWIGQDVSKSLAAGCSAKFALMTAPIIRETYTIPHIRAGINEEVRKAAGGGFAAMVAQGVVSGMVDELIAMISAGNCHQIEALLADWPPDASS